MSEEATEGGALVEGDSTPVAPSTPVRSRSCLGSWMSLAGVVVGAFYVTNPGAGVFELIPDNFPLFGNLDEAAATTALVLGLQYLFGRDRAG